VIETARSALADASESGRVLAATWAAAATSFLLPEPWAWHGLAVVGGWIMLMVYGQHIATERLLADVASDDSDSEE